ncbi:MAG: ABC transporter permease [Lachnospiraceae bacterium]
MTAFIAILKNDLYRLLEEKYRMILMQVLIAGAIVVAIFMSTRTVTAGNIALISYDGDEITSSPYLNVTVLDKTPPMSELVSNKYDAVVTFSDDSYDIQTIKSTNFKSALEAVLADPSGYHGDTLSSRGTATNILGYMVMFILMQGVFLMYLFAEDKEKKQITRISASPISFTGYLFAHNLFAFLSIFIPTLIILFIVSIIMGADLGMGFVQYTLLIGLLCALATTFSLFLNSLFKIGDSANMSGSAIVVLTSILAGSFYSFEKNNALLDTIITVLPQKSFLTITQAVESSSISKSVLLHIAYIIILILTFFIFSVIKTRREYIRSN